MSYLVIISPKRKMLFSWLLMITKIILLNVYFLTSKRITSGATSFMDQRCQSRIENEINRGFTLFLDITNDEWRARDRSSGWITTQVRRRGTIRASPGGVFNLKGLFLLAGRFALLTMAARILLITRYRRNSYWQKQRGLGNLSTKTGLQTRFYSWAQNLDRFLWAVFFQTGR